MKRPALHSVVVFAPDLDLARDFYCEILGFTLSRESDSHLELSGADFQLLVFRCEVSASSGSYSTRAGASFAIAVSDLDAEARRLRGRGVTILHDEPASGPVGRYVAIVDPFGVVHELVEPAADHGGRRSA